MSGPIPRRAIEGSLRQRARGAAAPGAIVAGLVATGLALATIPSPTSATSATAGFSVAPLPTTSVSSFGTVAPSAAEIDALELDVPRRQVRANRSTARPSIPKKAEPKLDLDVSGTRYTTVALNVRTKADADARLVTVLKPGVKVKITDTARGQWRLIVRGGKGQWVKKRYLAKSKPTLSAGGTVSTVRCKSGSGMEAGLTPDAIKVHRALCARFPQVSSFGGVRPGDGGEHGSGRAVDAMISSSTVGWQMANWLRANAQRLGASEVIYSQQIWTVQRSGEGWRGMSDRGSATANHYDHVHITVYGNSAR